MFRGGWAIGVAALALVGVAMRSPVLLLMAVLLFLAGAVARAWDRSSLSRLSYARRLTPVRAQIGERVWLETTVTNDKPLPLPWLRVVEELPDGVESPDTRLVMAASPQRQEMEMEFSLGWYQRVTRRYAFDCRKRGVFSIGPATLTTGDPFGVFQQRTVIHSDQKLIVYPHVLPLERLGIPSADPFGIIAVRRHFMEDPSRPMGAREYAPGDPLKWVHWKATARTGSLHTRLFQPSTTPNLALFLDVRTLAAPMWGSVEEMLELAVTTAASIANHALERGVPVGLYANHGWQGDRAYIRVPPALDPDQQTRVLEALAYVGSFESIPMADLLVASARELPWSTTVVAVTAVPSVTVLTALARLRRASRRVALVTIGNETLDSTVTMPVYRVPLSTGWSGDAALPLVESARGGRR